jgi:hypothetical protein
MDEWDDWSPKSFEFHKIPRKKLLASGEDPRRVARQMIDELAGKPVYSDEPQFDNMWKDRLLIDSGFDPALIRIKNLKYFLNKIIKIQFPGKRYVDLFQEFSTEKTTRHRAGADVMWLFKFVEFVTNVNAERSN